MGLSNHKGPYKRKTGRPVREEGSVMVEAEIGVM